MKSITKSITIRINEELHKKLKIKMVENNKTIQEHVIDLIEKDLNEPKKKEEK